MRGLWRLVLTVYCFAGFFLCLFDSSSSSSSPPPAARASRVLICDSRDRDALVGFSRRLVSGVPGWPRNASSSNCCHWRGVRCGISSSAQNTSVSGSRLVGLELGKNSLTGAVDGESLLGLDELRTLNLSENMLGGVIPAALFRLRHLEVLDLSLNEFSGPLSDGIGNLSALRNLNISFNNFAVSDTVAFRILSRLRQLEVLDLSGNAFSGPLSDGIANLSALRLLDISFNAFSGSIPEVFGGLRRLERFSARNNYFNGSLPASLSSCSMLTSLDLGNNDLTGGIGLVDFKGLVRLRTLRLDSNKLVGRIPRSLSSCAALEYLNLADNQLHGHIPWAFKYLQALSSLSLSSNGLSDISRALTILSACWNLTALDLTGNFRGEAMPADGIGPGFDNLKLLVVANCALSGSVPPWLGSRSQLRLLDLSFNRLAGVVPPWLGNLTHLFYLDLSNNSIGGGIPDTLAHLSSLTSENRTFSKDSPVELPVFVRRKSQTASRVLAYRYPLVPPTLDLSHNLINGPIPRDLGNLIQLVALDLSNNYLSGPLPEELSRMSMLESLDLSFNNLSGSIPPSLTQLSFLSRFSVAYNKLVGRVPLDRQFATFEGWSYEGNPGLCGRPLSECVPLHPPAGTGTGTEGKFRITFMPVPYGIGVAIGFIPTVLCGFYRRRRKNKQRQD